MTSHTLNTPTQMNAQNARRLENRLREIKSEQLTWLGFFLLCMWCRGMYAVMDPWKYVNVTVEACVAEFTTTFPRIVDLNADCFHYSWSIVYLKKTITISQSKMWCIQMTFLVQPTLQNPKGFTLQYFILDICIVTESLHCYRCGNKPGVILKDAVLLSLIFSMRRLNFKLWICTVCHYHTEEKWDVKVKLVVKREEMMKGCGRVLS